MRFQEPDGSITLSLEGHLDERDANSVLEETLFQARTMEAAYRVMDPEGAVPQAILDYDKRSKELAETTAPGVLEATGPGAALPSEIKSPLAKKSDHAYPGSDANWDWTADANWWKDVVGYKCGWHEALHYANFTWVDDWRQGWYSRGYLMAASHTYGANAYAYIWKNGAWSQTNSMYLQPRHYVVWYSGDASKQYRRYRVVGNGGNYARTHWGMRRDLLGPAGTGRQARREQGPGGSSNPPSKYAAQVSQMSVRPKPSTSIIWDSGHFIGFAGKRRRQGPSERGLLRDLWRAGSLIPTRA